MIKYLQNFLDILLTAKRFRAPLIVFLSILLAIAFSELFVYIQIELFWSDTYHQPGYWIGFWTPLIDGAIVGFLAVFMLEQYEKKVLAEKEQMDASIEYASLIQKAMFTQSEVDDYFQEHFKFLKQRDSVGGDFYSMTPINEDELLIIVIDGIGHGVSGAFVTMLAKAVEYQIVNEIHKNHTPMSSAQILSRFNELFKQMCDKNTSVNVTIGFDAGVVYFNKKKKIVQFSGAKIPLWVVDNGVCTSYKGDRKGIGFIRTPIDYAFSEYEIPVHSGMRFYLATDGIFDQDGVKANAYGKARFAELITKEFQQPLAIQRDLIIKSLKAFQGNKKQLDDITLLGFSF